MVPVSQDSLVDGDLLIVEDRLQRCYPFWLAFAGIDEQSFRALTDDVCIRALDEVQRDQAEESSLRTLQGKLAAC